MNKKIIKLLSVSIVLLIALGLAYFYYSKTNQEPSNPAIASAPLDIIDRDELNELNLYHLGVYEAVSRDEQGKVTAYKFLGLKKEEPIDLELMTDLEKMTKGVATSTKIQVLERDSQGNVTVYHLINSDADIISKY